MLWFALVWLKEESRLRLAALDAEAPRSFDRVLPRPALERATGRSCTAEHSRSLRYGVIHTRCRQSFRLTLQSFRERPAPDGSPKNELPRAPCVAPAVEARRRTKSPAALPRPARSGQSPPLLHREQTAGGGDAISDTSRVSFPPRRLACTPPRWLPSKGGVGLGPRPVASVARVQSRRY